MKQRTAACACGSVRIAVEGEPARLSICHCDACKRRTGSAFSWNATFPADQVAIEGETRSWQRDSDEGYWGRHHFCPRCGATAWYEIERRPSMISIPAGNFTDPDFPAPSVEVYWEKRCPWLPAVPGAEQF